MYSKNMDGLLTSIKLYALTRFKVLCFGIKIKHSFQIVMKHDQGGVSFVDPFCYLCFEFIFVILSCLFLKTLWSPSVKRLTYWLSCV